MKTALVYFNSQQFTVKFDRINNLDDFKGGTVLYSGDGYDNIVAVIPKEALIIIE